MQLKASDATFPQVTECRSASAMPTLAAAALSIMMLASFALVAGGVYLIATKRNRKQGILMLICAAVLVVNVLIWTLPG